MCPVCSPQVPVWLEDRSDPTLALLVDKLLEADFEVGHTPTSPDAGVALTVHKWPRLTLG